MTASGSRIAEIRERWAPERPTDDELVDQVNHTDADIAFLLAEVDRHADLLTPERLAPLIEEAIEAEQATSGGNDYRSRKPGLFIASRLLAALEAQP